MVSIWKNLNAAAHAVGEAATAALTVDTVRLAVTGLSGAGKTNFLVSVISNLLSMVAGPAGPGWDSLPALRKKLTDARGKFRLLRIEIEPPGASTVPRFRYEDFRNGLALPAMPKWPKSTDKATSITLKLVVQPRTGLGAMAGVVLGNRVIRLELLDYPGEWLVDLPLLDQSFQSWSEDAVKVLSEPARHRMATEFLAFLGTLAVNAPVDDGTATAGFERYCNMLARFREEAGLRWLQPGRFLMPGTWKDAPFLHFFPWPAGSQAGPGTLGDLLSRRFDVYKAESRKQFFDPHFRAFNRQVVLVDVLAALFAGQTAFEDVRTFLGRVAVGFTNSNGAVWPFGTSIERVSFAATKSDHVDDLQRNNLRLILQEMVDSSAGAAKPNINRSFHAISSIRCTTDDTTTAFGPAQRVVMGVPMGALKSQAFSAGTVPAGAVPPAFWGASFLKVPILRPPLLAAGGAFPVEHIDLDELLADLLGDVL